MEGVIPLTGRATYLAEVAIMSKQVELSRRNADRSRLHQPTEPRGFRDPTIRSLLIRSAFEYVVVRWLLTSRMARPVAPHGLPLR